MMLRSQPEQGAEDRPRLNLLVSYGGWRDQPAVEQLARLLRPIGIESINVGSGEEAADVIRQIEIHIAVVDVTIPLHRAPSDESPRRASAPGGGRLLQLLRRLEPAPPTVIVRPPQPATRESVRGLAEALREGAFAVVDRPVHLETLLEVLRRVLRRHYADHWPAAQAGFDRPQRTDTGQTNPRRRFT